MFVLILKKQCCQTCSSRAPTRFWSKGQNYFKVKRRHCPVNIDVWNLEVRNCRIMQCSLKIGCDLKYIHQQPSGFEATTAMEWHSSARHYNVCPNYCGSVKLVGFVCKVTMLRWRLGRVKMRRPWRLREEEKPGRLASRGWTTDGLFTLSVNSSLAWSK